MSTEAAPAKINLALHVTGQRGDGYHLLDSLVVFAGFSDALRFDPADDLSLQVTGPMAEGVPTGRDNLILRAAGLFAVPQGAKITLDKNLPHAAGIGGGSADAAATLRGLSRLWGCEIPCAEDCLRLGADLPVCVSAKPQRMQGIGEVLSPVPALPSLFAVMVNPRVAVPTADVFRNLSCKDNPPMETPAWRDFSSFITWLSRHRNDLETPACTVAPEVSEVLQALTLEGAELARMSGSGATCFGLFETKGAADRAAQTLQAQHPAWWVQATDILS